MKILFQKFCSRNHVLKILELVLEQIIWNSLLRKAKYHFNNCRGVAINCGGAWRKNYENERGPSPLIGGQL